MKIFHLLAGASGIAIVFGTGVSTALETRLGPSPVAVVDRQQLETLGPRDITDLLYFAPSLSVLGGGAFVPEVGAGIELRGIGGPRLNLSIEGSGALYQPGSVGELWIGSRVGFSLDDVNKIEVVGSGSVGLIGGTPSYRAGLGGLIHVLPKTDLVIEGVIGGHFGSAPTDNGIRAGVHFFPGRTGSLFADDGRAFESGFITDPTLALWAGPSITSIPSAGAFVPAIDAGLAYKTGSTFDFGLRTTFGYQLPAANYEASVGGEAGYQFTPQFRGFADGMIGTIGGGFTFNKIGLGLEYSVTPSVSLTGEVFGRGGLGTVSEAGFTVGSRFNILDNPVSAEGPTLPTFGTSGVDPYIGKSLAYIPSGGGIFIPSIEAGLDFPLENGLVPGLRAGVGYQFPAGILETSLGGKLGYQVAPRVQPYVFGDFSMIGTFPANTVGVGTEIGVTPNISVSPEVFTRGGLGSFTEAGFKFRAAWHASSVTVGERSRW